MIIFSLIQVVISCVLHSEQQKEISLYPTDGEYLEYSLSNLFKGESLIYNYEPIIPNVKIVNTINQQTQLKGHDFKSLSYNYTHFATITQENHIILYNWRNESIQQNGQIIIIEEKYRCYNIILFNKSDILLDCYAKKNFYLLKLMNTNFLIVYSIEANNPNKTKMYRIFDQQQEFLIYVQYYQNQSTLTLFSTEYQNLSSFQNQFIDDSIPLRDNPNIYLLYQSSIQQLTITSNKTFIITAQYPVELIFKVFQVYYDYQTSSQCDQIYILIEESDEEYINFQFQGCQDLILLSNVASYDNKKLNKLFNLFFNSQFVLLQSLSQIIIYQQIDSTNCIGRIQVSNNAQIIFDIENNYIFSFHQEIIFYQLKQPQLSIDLTKQYKSQNKYQIVIYAQFKNITNYQICKMNMSIQILNQNDTNIYVMFNQNFQAFGLLTSYKVSQFVFVGYSGKLLSYQPNSNNEQFGQFQKNTFQEIFQFKNQSFKLAQLLYPIYLLFNQYEYVAYFIGITNRSIQIYNYTEAYSYNLMKIINISINAKQLQVAYNMYSTIIIGVSEKDTIYLYQLQQDYTLQISKYQYQFEFSEFLITYNHLMTLFLNKEIQIMSLNFTNLVVINQNVINKLIKSVNELKFSPIQIVINTQYLSSCLFINNIKNIIILAIGQNNQPIPVNIIEFSFKIQQINIVHQQLVISYLCNNGLDICFQVWNIQNVLQPYFVKNLMSVNNENQLQIQSDNLFFYVTFSNYTVFVYNPQLPEQMSLYYLLQLSSQLMSSVQYNTNSFIYCQNSIYTLSIYQGVLFSVNQSLNFDRSYPSIIYNYTVTSYLNQTAMQYTPNQSLVYFSNFTIFQPKTDKKIILKISDLNLYQQSFTIPISLLLNRQVNVCYFQNSSFQNSYYSYQLCNLTNFNYQIKLDYIIQNYALITTINNQLLILQDNNQLLILNQQLEYLGQFYYISQNFTECLKSTSFDYTLSSICQNQSGQYWLSISFDSQGSVIQQNLSSIPYRFSSISKIANIQNLNLILGSLYSSEQNVYQYNSLNNTIQLMYQDNFVNGSSCQDFSVTQFNITWDFDNHNRIIIVYIINQQPYSQYIYIGQHSIVVELIQEIIWINDSVYFIQSLILQVINNQIYILFTNIEGFGQLLIFNFQLTENNLQIYAVVGSIPSYGTLLPIPNSRYKDGILLQQFQQGNNYFIAVYQINEQLDDIQEIYGLNDPILMLGSQFTTSLEYDMIVNYKYQNGTCLLINNGSLYNYPINTKTLTCNYLKRSKTINVELICQNEFSVGIYQLTFILPALEQSKRGWIYSLLIIIGFLLTSFYFLIRYRIRRLRYINTQIQIEL